MAVRLLTGLSLCCPQTQSSYILTIKGTDMNGAPGGNTGTGTIQVKVVDVNDNKPMLDKDEVSIQILFPKRYSDMEKKQCH